MARDEPGLASRSTAVKRRSFLKASAATSGALALSGCALFGSGSDDGGGSGGGGDIPDEPLKLGATSFMSGPATILGEPVTNTVNMLVDQVNAEGGILGEREIELTLIDEVAEGGSDRFREFAADETDVVIGYGSTSNAMEVAPFAEDLEQLTIFHDTGALEMYEEVIDEPQWTFRTGATLSVDAVGAARVVANRLTDVQTVAGIHPDYGYGRGVQEMFRNALSQIAPDVEVVSERFPPLLDVSDYSPHIDALKNADPDFIFSALWGGDAVTFLQQAQEQNLFQDRISCNMATHIFGEHPDLIPDGHLWWPRGPHFPFMDATNPDNEAYVDSYINEFDSPPWGHTAFHFVNAFRAYIAAVEKAYDIAGGWPSDEQIISALENISQYSTGGHLPNMTRRGGHQGIEPAYLGFSQSGENQYGPTLTDEIWIAPELVNPPRGMSHSEWIDTMEPVR